MYDPIFWKDHFIEYARRYSMTQGESAGLVYLHPAPGEVEQQGTPQNAANFSRMDYGILEQAIMTNFLYVSTKHYAETLNDVKDYAYGVYEQSTGYTDKKIADLIGGAPETLDTIEELATAIKENEDVVKALDAAIGKKANQSVLETHMDNEYIHVDANKQEKWNGYEQQIADLNNNLALQSTDNLIPYPHKDSTMTSNGITWTDNSDGTITANGTATADSIFLLQGFSVPAGTYTVSGSPNITNCRIQLMGSNDWSMHSTAGSKNTITYSADKAYTYCRCIILKGTTVKDAVFKPQLERGNVAHAYTPYRNNKTAYAICATGRATAAKVAELADFVLTVGTTIAVKFTDTAGTANPTSGNLTLNVNGTGDKAMGYFRSGAKASLIYVHGANFCNNAVHIFTYDGTYWLCMDWNADNNTTYSNMTGATASAAGKAGLVPAPSAGKQGQFLRGDGTWATPVAVQNNLTSTSTTDALSAAQGKVLNNAIVKNANDISTLNSNLLIIGELISTTVTVPIDVVANQETEYRIIDNLSNGNYLICANGHVDNAPIPSGKRLWGALASHNYAAAMNIDSTATSWQWNQTMLFRGQGCTLRILSEVDFNCELKLALYLMRVR